MLYEKEYLATRNKSEFSDLINKRYPHLKESSVERRFYDCRKELGEQIQHHYPETEKQQLQPLKRIMFDDMKRFGNKINRKELTKYGFKEFEINWLEDEGEM